MFFPFFIWLGILHIPLSFADTPANCTYEDAHGSWLFEIHDNQGSVSERLLMNLLYPNLALDEFGNRGYWTLIYNQGFEITIAYRKWLAMFAFNNEKKSLCHKVDFGRSHDILLRQPKTFTGLKQNALNQPRSAIRQPTIELLDQMYTPNPKFVALINSVQKSWMAVDYPELMQYTLRDLRRRAGGSKSTFPRLKTFGRQNRVPSLELRERVAQLPVEFDWRFPPDGTKSPLTPVRNQHTCGSCYAFASAAALEARIQLKSNFTRQPILSPQDIVDCSPYSEGCEGGFPYLIAGKYAEDFGLVSEECAPYTAKESKCHTYSNCTRYYATDYQYIGGYYGATNEQLMLMELVHNGPFPVGFEVYNDFLHYKSGVYQHTTAAIELQKFDPFELTNHAVLLVGYGVDSVSGLPYWSVKNSWGLNWGEEGYFRILRGSDECGIESLGVSVHPVL